VLVRDAENSYLALEAVGEDALKDLQDHSITCRVVPGPHNKDAKPSYGDGQFTSNHQSSDDKGGGIDPPLFAPRVTTLRQGFFLLSRNAATIIM
jgi:hypothetical protein